MDWQQVDSVFEKCPPVVFQQFWKGESDKNFRSGEVRTGWSEEGVWVSAVLEDEDIFNPEESRNAFFFCTGDVFEIFVRPDGQDSYFEFHVGPANQHLQLRFPSPEAFAAKGKGDLDGWKIDKPLMRSMVSVEPERNRWRILALLPFDGIVEQSPSPQSWRISFSRYDYTQGNQSPVLSSTSPHEVANFHRLGEWATMTLHPAQDMPGMVAVASR